MGPLTYCNNLGDFFWVQENVIKMASRLDTKLQSVGTDDVESPFQMFMKVNII